MTMMMMMMRQGRRASEDEMIRAISKIIMTTATLVGTNTVLASRY